MQLPGPLQALLSRRLLAPIGGTTTLDDCAVALALLLQPWKLVRGSAVGEYERAFAQEIGVQHALAFASGRLGLFGMLQALGVGPGDEVLMQVPTHVVVPNAVRYTGARPVYVDCHPDNYNINLALADRQVTDRTRVLLVQHTFGCPVDMDAALTIARRHNLFLLEDCAHALGSTYGGKAVGTFGDAAFFSTEEKTITSAMGGMVVTNHPETAARMRRFQSECAAPSNLLAGRYMLKLIVFHFITQPPVHRYLRFMYKLFRSRYIAPAATSPDEERGARPRNHQQRLSNAQATLALRQLERLPSNVAHRRMIANLYRAMLAERGVVSPRCPSGAEAVFARYPVLVADRAVALSSRRRAAFGQWLNSVIDGAVPPADEDYVPGSCPVAEALVRQLVNLPTHPHVTEDDAREIMRTISEHRVGMAL
jgi:dTDP-4-amino-4,6-dideoxygalactose transaminase